jgi:pimeloyl-ACP methyl ester carboxylesterase
MKQRIFLLPGYGEDHRAFRQLAPYLGAFELIPVDYRAVLSKLSVFSMSSEKLAKMLVSHYHIRERDLLAGHSMGGYLSFHIRELQGNRICMIGSFSDPGKIVHLVPDWPVLTPVFAGTGFSKTKTARRFLQKKVAGRDFEQAMMEVVDNFRTFSNEELLKLSLLTLEKKPFSQLPNPLRIHADNDRTVRPPDESYHKVEGGHFCLNLYPEQVFNAMETFIHP